MVIARIACGPIHAPNFGFSIYPDGARDQLVKKCVFLHKSKVSPPLSDADIGGGQLPFDLRLFSHALLQPRFGRAGRAS